MNSRCTRLVVDRGLGNCLLSVSTGWPPDINIVFHCKLFAKIISVKLLIAIFKEKNPKDFTRSWVVVGGMEPAGACNQTVSSETTTVLYVHLNASNGGIWTTFRQMRLI